MARVWVWVRVRKEAWDLAFCNLETSDLLKARDQNSQSSISHPNPNPNSFGKSFLKAPYVHASLHSIFAAIMRCMHLQSAGT